MLLTIIYNAMKFIQALSRLRIKIDIFGEIQLTHFLQLFHLIKLLYNNRMAFRLTHQS